MAFVQNNAKPYCMRNVIEVGTTRSHCSVQEDSLNVAKLCLTIISRPYTALHGKRSRSKLCNHQIPNQCPLTRPTVGVCNMTACIRLHCDAKADDAEECNFTNCTNAPKCEATLIVSINCVALRGIKMQLICAKCIRCDALSQNAMKFITIYDTLQR